MMIDPAEARRMLVALLRNPNDTLPDVSALDSDERLFAIPTCAAVMIEESICATAAYDAEAAMLGLDSLVHSMRAHVVEICQRERATRQ